MRLDGKVAIVTGGGKGIGGAYSAALAAEGARVVIAELDEAAARLTAESIERNGGEAVAIPTDVASERSVAAMVGQTLDHFGKIDGLVNNAALFADMPRHASWEEIGAEEWDQVMAVNLRGVFFGCRAVVPAMRREGGGSIVNISSTTVLNGGQGSPHYVASKAGVMGLTRSLARLVGEDNIRVNTVAPGRTASDTFLAKTGIESFATNTMVRAIKRVQRSEDLAGTVVFLLSDESALMTGQMLVVDGGKDFH